jgi:CBS domain-containing protein
MLEHIKQILDRKGPDVICIGPDDSLYDALRLMADNNIGALVVKEGEHLMGILSERDYARELVLCRQSCLDIKVRNVMSKEIYFAKPETSIEEAMAIVTETRCRHLPVIDNGELIGLVSIGDLVKSIIDEKNFVIKQMEKYIKGEL